MLHAPFERRPDTSGGKGQAVSNQAIFRGFQIVAGGVQRAFQTGGNDQGGTLFTCLFKGRVVVHARLKKVLEAWGKCYDLYFDALTVKDEADYFREMLDRALRRVVPEGEHFDPFEQRYEWLPRILYGEKGKKGGVSR